MHDRPEKYNEEKNTQRFKNRLENVLCPESFKQPNEENEGQDGRNLVSYLYAPKEGGSLHLPEEQRHMWSRIAFWVSILSVFVSLTFSLASFLVSSQTDSSSVFATAFDALLGTLSSFAVAWRFRDLLKGGLRGKNRERIATAGIGVGFVATGIATVAASILHLIDKIHPSKTTQMLTILTCSSVSFLTLSWVQRCLAKKLNSQSLRAVSADNALAAAMSFGILISTFVYWNHRKLWWLDHSVALFLGVFSGSYGLHLFLLTVVCNKELFGVKVQEEEALTE